MRLLGEDETAQEGLQSDRGLARDAWAASVLKGQVYKGERKRLEVLQGN